MKYRMNTLNIEPMKLLALVFFSAVDAYSPTFAAVPAFDCNKADHEIEKLICADDELAAMDLQMANVFKQSLQAGTEAALNQLRVTQRGWVKGRNDCWKADDKRDCVQTNYEMRITELQITYGLVEVPDAVAFDCAGKGAMTAVFYQKTQKPAVVLTRFSDQAIAYIGRSGSGSKYDGQDVIFWEKGGEAMVTWKGEEFLCTKK